MEIGFTFTNGTPNVREKLAGNKPVELKIEDGGTPYSKESSLSAYLRSIDYMFRGVGNLATGVIKEVRLDAGNLGRVRRQNESVVWEVNREQTSIVVYEISHEEIKENLYIADGIVKGKKRGVNTPFKNITPIWVKEVIKPTHKQSVMKENLIKAISITTKYLSDVQLTWLSGNGFSKDRLAILDKNKREVDISEIENDEEYIIVRLLTMILSKGEHQGVFLINGKHLSDNAVNALYHIGSIFYGQGFVFLYNMKENSGVVRDTVILPDYSFRSIKPV